MSGTSSLQKTLLSSVNSTDKDSLPLGYLQLAAKQVLTAITNSREFAKYYDVPLKTIWVNFKQ